jgi:hypothetical protein
VGTSVLAGPEVRQRSAGELPAQVLKPLAGRRLNRNAESNFLGQELDTLRQPRLVEHDTLDTGISEG